MTPQDVPTFYVDRIARRRLKRIRGWLAEARRACRDNRPAAVIVGDGKGDDLVVLHADDLEALLRRKA